MNLVRTYRSFVNSHYLTEGIRMTAGILLPAFVMIYFNKLDTGIVLSVGAMCVSVSDTAGPIHHRRNAMMICNAAIFLVSLAVGLASHSSFLLTALFFVCCFFFSMLGVYGARAGSIGFAALLIMVLNLNRHGNGREALLNATYLMAGGVWYMMFSIALYRIMPHKLIQQVIGDYIEGIAIYLRTRASFYKNGVDYEAAYASLLHQQVNVQEKQDLVHELLFKNSTIVNQSTGTGRILVMIYLDAADLFEKVMTSFLDYRLLHKYFDETLILQKFHDLAAEFAAELDNIGIALKSRDASRENSGLIEKIKETRSYFNELRVGLMNSENIEGFISLRYILENIEDIGERIRILHRYTTYDRKLGKRIKLKSDFGEPVSHQDITPQIFIDNLTFDSNIFRHSLRVSIAVIAGYLVSKFFPLGHGYWILLTIIVILKPAYSLTKQRNRDRLIGTFCGVILGIIILYFIKNNTTLLIIMIILMAGTYTFIRRHYFVGVLLLTPYIIIFFHLLNLNDFKTVFADRIIDTVIGSMIAFVASISVIPGWERKTIKALMTKMLEQNRDYFKAVTISLAKNHPVVPISHKTARKNAYVALANLSDAFSRMTSEPKSQQKDIEQIKKFVVLNHRLASHIATLSYYQQSQATTHYSAEAIENVINHITRNLDYAAKGLLNEQEESKDMAGRESITKLNEEANILLERRRAELQQGKLETATKELLSELKSFTDQFNFIYRIVEDMRKIVNQLPLE